MKIVDVNRMIGPIPHHDFGLTIEDTIAEMERLGIDQAFVSHSYSRYYDADSGNTELMALLAKSGMEHKNRLFPVWTLEPSVNSEIALSSLKENHISIVRFWPLDHGYGLETEMMGKLLAQLEKMGIVILVDLPQTSWKALYQICTAFPLLKIVVGNVGYRSLNEIVDAWQRFENLFVDLSYFASHQGVEYLIERLGSDKIVFGTGSPEKDPGGAIARLIYTITDSIHITNIANGNLMDLLEGVKYEK